MHKERGDRLVRPLRVDDGATADRAGGGGLARALRRRGARRHDRLARRRRRGPWIRAFATRRRRVFDTPRTVTGLPILLTPRRLPSRSNTRRRWGCHFPAAGYSRRAAAGAARPRKDARMSLQLQPPAADVRALATARQVLH